MRCTDSAASHSSQNLRSDIVSPLRHSYPSAMFQLLNVALTIFALLVCPIRCHGGLTSVSTVAQGHVKAAPACGCKCCARHRATSEKSGAPSQEDGCGCGSCLCHGAVTTAKVSVPAIEPCEFLVASFALDVTPSVEMLVLAKRGDPDEDSTPRAGRPLRFELQSLLN
ncbi:MAG: hypothetical protein IT428_33385 [Planctomycetaceae bacterium]|nr:hypothetical protein [Planctomycetaceae bacterium]